MEKISIIIPIHNRLEVTKEGLRSIYQSLKGVNEFSQQFEFEIIVIDDGSTDNSGKWIKEHYSKVHLLEGDGELWWSGAVNVGVKFAIEKLSSSFILLWNNDVIPHKDYFKNLLLAINENKDRVIGPYIYDHTTKDLWATGGRFNTLTGARTMKIGKIKENKYVYPWLTGMGTLIPTAVVKKIGYWDNINFPQYHGDFDFTLRAAKEGVDVVSLKNLIIYNKTEYSTYQGVDIKSFFKSFTKKGSRYNIYDEIKIYRKHCVSPLWIISFSKKYLIYTLSFLKKMIYPSK